MTVEVAIAESVAVVTLNRPEKKNALTADMRAALQTAFEAIAEDAQVRAVVLSGAGGQFCSGVDVGEMGAGGVAGSLARVRSVHRVGRAIMGLAKPVVAAVSGVCMGVGWSYALSCDLVLADESARFGLVFNRIGLSPDGGASWLLRQHLGLMQAKALVYAGREFGADEALRLGLLVERVEGRPVLERAMELARGFAKGPTLAYGAAKRQLEAAAASTYEEFLELEVFMQPLLARTADHAEGVQAFRERRPPRFTGA